MGRLSEDSHGLGSLTDREREAVVSFVAALVDQDHDALESAGAFDPPGADPYLWTNDYGRWGRVHLVMPPGDSRQWSGGVYRSDDGAATGVDVDMWTEEEGRSDLTLQVDLLASENGSVSTRFGGLHVM